MMRTGWFLNFGGIFEFPGNFSIFLDISEGFIDPLFEPFFNVPHFFWALRSVLNFTKKNVIQIFVPEFSNPEKCPRNSPLPIKYQT
jgi:hypothetical protein